LKKKIKMMNPAAAVAAAAAARHAVSISLRNLSQVFVCFFLSMSLFLSFYVFVSFFIYFCLSLFVCLFLSFCFFVSFFLSMSLFLSLFLSVFLSFFLSFCFFLLTFAPFCLFSIQIFVLFVSVHISCFCFALFLYLTLLTNCYLTMMCKSLCFISFSFSPLEVIYFILSIFLNDSLFIRLCVCSNLLSLFFIPVSTISADRKF